MARRSAALLAVLASALAAGCGGAAPAGRPPTSTMGAPRAVLGPGRLVPIGGRRSLYLNCQGSGRPTVMLEAGFGGDSSNWWGVQPQLARTTRTCAYDRAGFGNSVARPGVHDARDDVADLERLLAAARLPPPYVLVGHSYGGMLVRLFAHARPAATAGLVLVESMTPGQTRRQMAIWPRSVAPSLRRAIAAPVRDGVDLAAGEAAAGRVRSLGATPLVVVTAGAPRFGGVRGSLARRLGRLWLTMQGELAGLSSDAVHVVALRSDHFVQFPGRQPSVVVAAVRAVVDAARAHAPLGPCARLFDGPAVRCIGR